MNEYPLNTKWILWYHSINDTKWNKSSYKNLFEINNLYELKCINDTISKLHLQNGGKLNADLWEEDITKKRI